VQWLSLVASLADNTQVGCDHHNEGNKPHPLSDPAYRWIINDAYNAIPPHINQPSCIGREYHLLGLLYHPEITYSIGNLSTILYGPAPAITKTPPDVVSLFLGERVFTVGMKRRLIGGYPLVIAQRSPLLYDIDPAIPLLIDVELDDSFEYVWLYLSGLEPNMKPVTASILLRMIRYIVLLGVHLTPNTFMDDYLYHILTDDEITYQQAMVIYYLSPANVRYAMYVTEEMITRRKS